MVPQNPLARAGWSGNNLGDFWVGAKVNLTSQWQQQPAAFAVRGLVKLPTGDTTSGASTGKADFAFDGVVSKEVNERVEVSGYAGFIVRGSPDEVDTTNGFRWGFGAGFPTRKPLRFTAETEGEHYSNDTLVTKQVLTAEDGSFLPVGFISDVRSPVNLHLGLTWQGAERGVCGRGLDVADDDGHARPFPEPVHQRRGGQDGPRGARRLPPRRAHLRAAATPAAAATAGAAPQNHPPTVRARCEPCTVEIGKTSTVTGDAQDPDGDQLTYAWSAPTGTFATATARQTPWTAPMQEGPVPVTITVDRRQGRNGIAIRSPSRSSGRPVKEFVFEDVHFDFDRYSLRPEATRALDEAVRTLQANPDLRIEIEGHTCNIGTAEYNLALGERRATAVRDYLTSRGVGADRLRTVSYGEERPKFDNSREETRRLNRRAALVVRLSR